MKSGSVKDRS